jgi:hypothetical protein
MGLLPSRAPKRRMALRRMPLTSTAVLALLELYLLAPLSGLAAGEKLFLELNSAEAVENRCRLNFVVQNKSDSALSSISWCSIPGVPSDNACSPRWGRCDR